MLSSQSSGAYSHVAPFRDYWTDKSKDGKCRNAARWLIRELRRQGSIKRINRHSKLPELVESLLVNLAFHAGMNRRVLVSRTTSNSNPLPRLLDGMAAAGLIRQHIAPRASKGGITTEVEACRPLLLKTGSITAKGILSDRHELIELRNKNGERLPVPYRLARRESPAVRRLNRVMRGVVITVAGEDHPGPQYYRVFNGSEQHGGRWYHGLQNASKDERKGMLINGSPVVELDYSALHARMVYHLEGMEFPAGADPYTIPGVDRDVAKLLFMQLLNDSSVKSARQHLKDRQNPKRVAAYWRHRSEYSSWLMLPIGQRGKAPQRPSCLNDGFEPLGASVDVDQSIDDFLELHHAIAPTFDQPSQALRLQYHDARIAERVFADHVKLGRPVLGVHDSFIVSESHEADLRGIMTTAYRDEIGFNCPIS